MNNAIQYHEHALIIKLFARSDSEGIDEIARAIPCGVGRRMHRAGKYYRHMIANRKIEEVCALFHGIGAMRNDYAIDMFAQCLDESCECEHHFGGDMGTGEGCKIVNFDVEIG